MFNVLKSVYNQAGSQKFCLAYYPILYLTSEKELDFIHNKTLIPKVVKR